MVPVKRMPHKHEKDPPALQMQETAAKLNSTALKSSVITIVTEVIVCEQLAHTELRDAKYRKCNIYTCWSYSLNKASV